MRDMEQQPISTGKILELEQQPVEKGLEEASERRNEENLADGRAQTMHEYRHSTKLEGDKTAHEAPLELPHEIVKALQLRPIGREPHTFSNALGLNEQHESPSRPITYLPSLGFPSINQPHAHIEPQHPPPYQAPPDPFTPLANQSYRGSQPQLQAEPSLSPPSPVNTTKPKRKRANPQQLTLLNSIFEMTYFPSSELRQAIARELDMLPRSVQIWFQNRRALWRARATAGDDTNVGVKESPHPRDDESGGWSMLGQFNQVRQEGRAQEFHTYQPPHQRRYYTSVPLSRPDAITRPHGS